MRLSRLVSLTVAVILATGCAPAPEPPPPNPLAGSRLWADPQSAAARAAAGVRVQGRGPGAEALEGSPRSGGGAATDRLVPEIRVGLGSCCMVKGSNSLYTELKKVPYLLLYM